MYTLYFDKKRCIIEVKKASAGMKNATFTEDVVQYNNCYFVCTKRKLLIKKSIEIKQAWIDEIKELLVKYENIEIK